jgi:glyoxylase-like metal-dependent hydrolase (beta-lactamase superfamily II)
VTHGSLRIGSTEISVVCEGYAPLELSDEIPTAGVDWLAERARHPWAFHDEATWAWHVHAFAIRTPSTVVMVDVGIGGFPPFRPWAAHTDGDAALADAGIDAKEVHVVAHTHLHADHAGGAVADGEPRFPNAVHHVHPADWAHFARPELAERDTARGAMSVLERPAMLDLTESDHDVAPGIRVVHAPGHTPGHRAVVVRSDDDILLLTGDLLHTPAQVARPEVPSNHDVEPETACRSRLRLLERARGGAWRVAVSHFARPFGRVDADGWVASD